MDGSVVQSAVMLQVMITWLFMIAVVLYCLPHAIRKLAECLRILHQAAREFTPESSLKGASPFGNPLPPSEPVVVEGDLPDARLDPQVFDDVEPRTVGRGRR